MAQLLLLTSILLALSGIVKIRSGLKVGLGASWLALLELAVAVAALGAALAGLAGSTTLGWLVPAGVILVIVSSASHIARVSAHRRERDARVGARLSTYVRYMSGPETEPNEDI